MVDSITLLTLGMFNHLIYNNVDTTSVQNSIGLAILPGYMNIAK